MNVDLLDNIGIRVKIDELPGTLEYRQAYLDLFGRGRLGRFWMKWIFPHLRPKEWDRRFNRHLDLLQKRQAEFMNAVFEAVK